MIPRLRYTVIVFVGIFLCATSAAAQGSWTVTLTPTLNPLPIGSCAAVRLDVIDAETRAIPRRPNGDRVTIADFDVAVTSADGKSVAAQWLDVFHLQACGCQSGSVGGQGFVTATYPASALPASSRVAGVTAQGSATFNLGKADGTFQPPSCTQLAQAPPVASTPIPTRSAPVGRVAGQPASAPSPTVTGATPTGFRLASSVPIIATLAWDSMPGGVSYSLMRAVGTGSFIKVATRTQAEDKAARDIVPDPRDTYLYKLVVTYADASFGTSPSVRFVSPPLLNPPGFTAKDRGLGNVAFNWEAVGGAAKYRLDGPGLPSTGFHTTGTTTNLPLIPRGPNSWKLTTIFQGNFADYANPSIASAIVRVLPSHSLPWLSKNNGVGSSETVPVPILHICEGGRVTRYSANLAKALGQKIFCTDYGEGEPRFILLQWANVYSMRLWGDERQSATEAVYGNAVDLGVGRRSDCASAVLPLPTGRTTTCYAAAHGIPPGQAGFNDFNTITKPGEGMGDDFILAMMITKDQTGTTFMVFLKDSTILDGVKAPGYGRMVDRVSLDTEGPKFVPHACISCHGGKYNPKTMKVDGASFLPLDPGLLAFASPEDQRAQEETMRTINNIIVQSDPTSAVAQYIRGLYGNAVSVPGTLAKPDYVPQGWSPQAGFYRTVVKPYCATCHLAAPTSWNFASWDNFNENAGIIHAAVCGSAHSMPHSELQFKAFWTKDTGPVYLPGLLAATLGFPKC